MSRPRILVVDDKENILNLLRSMLEDSYEVVTAHDGPRALELAAGATPDVVVSDIRMPGMDGLHLLRAFKRLDPDVEVVLMTGYGTVPKAVEAMKAGAYDYLTKPFEVDQALLTISRASERRQLRMQARNLRATLDAAERYDRLVGKSPAMQAVFGLLQRAAGSDASVLITGETGTGKKLAARAIHHASARGTHPFVAVDCATPDAFIESGLFSAALRDPSRPGEHDQESTPRGTLFLANIERLTLSHQATLARVLAERRVASRPHSETEQAAAGARIISATSGDLKAATTAGGFRADLYYLIHVVGIHLPPLRERKEDIPLLAARFLDAQGDKHVGRVEGFTTDALEALVRYDWPGNVREFEHAIERAVALIDDARVPVEALPEEVRQWDAGAGDMANLALLSYREAVDEARDRGTREYLIALMREFGGAVTKAAERAGVERESLHRLLKRHGLRSNEFKDDPNGG